MSFCGSAVNCHNPALKCLFLQIDKSELDAKVRALLREDGTLEDDADSFSADHSEFVYCKEDIFFQK